MANRTAGALKATWKRAEGRCASCGQPTWIPDGRERAQSLAAFGLAPDAHHLHAWRRATTQHRTNRPGGEGGAGVALSCQACDELRRGRSIPDHRALMRHLVEEAAHPCLVTTGTRGEVMAAVARAAARYEDAART